MAGGKEHMKYLLQSVQREQSFLCDENEPLGIFSVQELPLSMNKANDRKKWTSQHKSAGSRVTCPREEEEKQKQIQTGSE